LAIALALAAAIVYGAADFLGGVASRRTATIGAVVWSQAVGLALLAGVLPLFGGAAVPADIAWGAVCGVAGAVAIVCLYRGLAIGTMGIVSPVSAVLGASVPVLYGLLFRGEQPTLPAWTFEDQVRACIDSGATVFSVTFGLLPAELVKLVKDAGMYIVGTATTVHEALLFAESGVDAIAAQGSEAGAHRGSFAKPFEQSMVGILSLVPQIVREVSLPVIAAGGIMDGRAIRAVLAVGAQAAQLGTAFLVTDECGVAESYKQAVLASRDDSTRVTRAFSGRPARGIVNRAMTEIEADDATLPYPYQNSLTRAMRTAAAKQDRAEFLSLWCGQAGHLARRMPAAELVRTLIAELSS